MLLVGFSGWFCVGGDGLCWVIVGIEVSRVVVSMVEWGMFMIGFLLEGIGSVFLVICVVDDGLV